jgi:beta-glucuronidase
VRLALACVLAAFAAIALAAPAGAAFKPPERAVTYDGPSGRFLMDGTWRLRLDRKVRGVSRRWFAERSTKSWKRKVTVPNAWNAGNFSAASMAGGVAWYRRDFKLPSGASRYDWLARFESTRYRATVWLNGREVGSHEGGYLPFEVQLRSLSRHGVNRLVVRVDNRQRPFDLPAGDLTTEGLPNGGWWNYGGLLGDVYLRRIDRIDMTDVRVFPRLDCRTCDAKMTYRVTVENYGDKAAPVTVKSRFGDQDVDLGKQTVGAGQRVIFRGATTVTNPHLWSPADPHLYPVTIDAEGAGGAAGWQLESGIRSITVENGRLLLNHAPMSFRGGFFHEDSPATGGAADPARMQLVIDRLKDVGGTLLRTHYPLDPYFHQLADREGVFIWSEIPFYQLDTDLVRRGDIQRKGLRQMRENILDKSIHPSILTWSIANELTAEPTGAERRYFRRQSSMIHALDPTRPVALVILGYPAAGCQRKSYGKIDLLGVNTYFGWYPGPNGSIADRRKLGPYLDKLRACYPDKAIADTELGAEGNRHGPVEDRGTYEFQSDWLDYTLGVLNQKKWLSGVTGMLIAFHARPGWSGGNPKPDPPMHEKGVFHYDGSPKPAAAVMSSWFHKTQQYDLPGP